MTESTLFRSAEPTGYEILECLYRGERSSVFRARDTKTGERIVLKTLSGALSSAETLARFKREVEITRRLGATLPGIARAREIVWVGDVCFMVLEDIGGESLLALSQKRKLDIATCLGMMVKVAETLDGVHARNVVHKDISPANIVVNLRTGELRLIDFGSSSELSHETPDFRVPILLEGTLAYMSPEQTGRMNRPLDYRSDFYSLGATFYELLAGAPPFTSKDPLELMHAHIARVPTPLHVVDPKIPTSVSKVIEKLLEKSADDRYQSAAGLVADLEACIAEVEQKLEQPDFVPGRHDFPRRFRLAHKLYGRRAEIDTLMRAFDRASSGPAELVLVKGFSGIGKSSLVHEVHKPITQKRGTYVAGKFDQLQRSIPYSALIHALTELIEQRLTESEASLAKLRKAIEEAVSDLGQVIVEVVPKASLLMGPTSPVPELPPAESERRLHAVMKRFIQAFCGRHRPLVLFIDDLQWACSSTLGLLESLLTSSDLHHVLVIGAYRDNEVGPSHPLVEVMRAIEGGPLRITSIALGNLRREDVIELLADALRCDRGRVVPLADLLIQKTQGNAFFLTQFFMSLHDDRLLTYEKRAPIEGGAAGQASWEWVWDIGAIERRDITENVVELMARKIARMPEEQQEILRIAACLGNRFDIERLRIACGLTERTLFDSLKPILEEGLLLPLSEGYKLLSISEDLDGSRVGGARFLHDRVQEASYSLIEPRLRPELHLTIGRRLRAATDDESLSDRVFEIVSQLDEGLALITDPAEAEDLARLNLLAGKRARASLSHATALSVLDAGVKVLSAHDPWKNHFDLTFELYNLLALSEYVTGKLEASQAHFHLLCEKARTPVQIGKVYGEAVYLHSTMNEYVAAIDIAREGLGRLGIDFPREVTDEILGQGFERAHATLGDREISELLDMHLLEDPELAAPLGILNNLIPPAWLAMPEGFAWSTLQMVSLSQEHGHTPISAFAYGIHALLLCNAPKQYERGIAYADLAVKLEERIPDLFVRGTIHFFIGCFVQFWTRNKRQNIRYFEIAHRACVESGANVYACYNIIVSFYQWFYSDLTLGDVVRRYEGFAPYMREVGDRDALGVLLVELRLARTLMSSGEGGSSLDGDGFSESAYVEELHARNYGNGFCYFYFAKMLAAFYAERFDEVLAMSEHVTEHYVYLHGSYYQGLFHFYRALSIAAVLSGKSGEEARALQATFTEDLGLFEGWARSCPDNWEHMWVLLKAEAARLQGSSMEALVLYQRAISLSVESGWLPAKALAAELCAKFCFESGLDDYGKMHIAQAMSAYGAWEATQKLDLLRARHPLSGAETAVAAIPAGIVASPTTSSQRSGLEHGTRDLASLLKASHALSQEVMVDALMRAILHAMVENAGARRGALILDRDGTLFVESEFTAFSSTEAPLEPHPLEASAEVPRSIVYLCHRTGEPVLREDVEGTSAIAEEPYFEGQRIGSFLCAPIEVSKKRTGVIYLENDIAEGAFTPESVEVVQILATQAAISLQNASHIARLEAAHADLTLQNQELEEQRLAVMALSAPILEVGEGILALPIIGAVSAERAELIVSSLLQKVGELRTRVVVVDMTGIGAMDEATAQQLMRLAGMVELLGSRMVLTGIRHEVAFSILTQGVELGRLKTYRSLKEALRRVALR